MHLLQDRRLRRRIRSWRAVHGAEQVNLFTDAWDDIRIRLTAVEQAYNNFQIQQVQRGGHVTVEDKRALADQLQELEETLNNHLYREYELGKDLKKRMPYEVWKKSHKPLHWYVDFYPLMAAGGFDAVIGNPPYVRQESISDSKAYFKTHYESFDGGADLYAYFMEKGVKLLRTGGFYSIIVSSSFLRATYGEPLRRTLKKNAAILRIVDFGGLAV
jgi:hypothetical protein